MNDFDSLSPLSPEILHKKNVNAYIHNKHKKNMNHLADEFEPEFEFTFFKSEKMVVIVPLLLKMKVNMIMNLWIIFYQVFHQNMQVTNIHLNMIYSLLLKADCKKKIILKILMKISCSKNQINQ